MSGADSASRGFPPVSAPDARILILGSLPGARSIAEQRYYAHPQNAFWRIMRDLVGADGSYERRCQALVDRRIALWDVLAQSHRPGSMDADIDLASARPNDFESFFSAHPDVERVCFNGKKAEAMFGRFVAGEVGAPNTERIGLPSTSPAYASMSYDEKFMRWKSALEPVLGGEHNTNRANA